MSIEKIIGILKTKGIPLIISTMLILCVFYIGKVALSKLIYRSSANKKSHQIATILTVLRSVWKYFILLIWVISSLNILGMFVTTISLMATIGAGGLIIGIGAQDFVKDIFNGLSIILENRFEIGDYVKINDLCGTVAALTLRTTKIIGDNRETVTFTNSQIGSIINYSKQNPTVLCKVIIADEEYLEKSISALKEATESFTSQYAAGNLKFIGVTNITPYGIELAVNCLCKIGNIFNLRCEINLAITQALIKAKVPITNGNISISTEEK